MDFNKAYSVFQAIRHAEEENGPSMDEALLNTRNQITTEYKASAKYINEAKEKM